MYKTTRFFNTRRVFLGIFLSISFLANNTLFAQNNLFGVIRDAETKESLVAATVQSNAENANISNLNGEYLLVVAPSDKKITISYTGYKPLVLDVDSLQKQSPKSGNLDIFLASFSQNLETTVISGSRFERKLTEETVSIEVLKNNFLNNNNVTNLSEAIDRVPGVQVLDGQVNIRNGSGYAYGAGSRVLIMVDDQPLLSADLSDAKWNFMPIENAEQIEVVKSAASVLYGASALNGVVHLRTAQASNTPYTNVTTYAGIYDSPASNRRWWTDELKQHPFLSGIYAAHRQKIGENLSMTLGLNAHYLQSYTKGCDEVRYRLNANFKYTLPKDKRWAIGLNSSFMRHGEGRFFIWKDGYNNNYVPANDPVSLDVYHTLCIDPYLTFRPDETAKHTLRGRYFLIKAQRGGGNLDLPVMMGNAEYQFQKEWKEKGLSLNAGAMYQQFSVFSNLFTAADTLDLQNGYKSGSNVAVYGQVDKKWFKKLNTTAGARIEQYSIDGLTTKAIPVFRLGANYSMSKNDFLRASWGQGFRLPSLAERFIDETISGTPLNVLPNASILPEFGWSSEIGYKHVFKAGSWKGYTDASLFLMHYDNMIEFSFGLHVPENRDTTQDLTEADLRRYLGFKSKNVAEAQIGGFEFSTQAQGKIGNLPTQFWTGYTYSYAGDLSSDPKQKDFGVFFNNAVYAFSNPLDSLRSESMLRYRNLHTFRFDTEVNIEKDFSIGTNITYNSAIQRIDDLFSGRGTLVQFVEFINNGPAVPGLREFMAANKNGNWVFDVRASYNINKKNKLSFIVNNVANSEYSLRPAKMNPQRMFNLRYVRTF